MSNPTIKYFESIGRQGGNETLKRHGSAHFARLSAIAKEKLGAKGRRDIALKANKARWKNK